MPMSARGTEISLETDVTNSEKTRILLLEDDPRFAELVCHALADSDPAFEVEHVVRLSTAIARLVRQPISVILTDLNVPDSSGSGTVRHLQRAAPNVPLIVLSGQGDLELALACVREGADEFLVKGTLGFEALPRLIHLAIERRARAAAPGTSDTGQQEHEADRTTLESIGLHLLQMADRTGLHVSVLFLKVDHPGPGLPHAPARTEEITSVLRRTVRRCDLVARLEPNEWAVVFVMQHADSDQAGTRLAEALMAAVAGAPIRMGVATYHPAGTETIDDLIAQASRDLHCVSA